jgi:TLC ATP/ADP transporter
MRIVFRLSYLLFVLIFIFDNLGETFLISASPLSPVSIVVPDKIYLIKGKHQINRRDSTSHMAEKVDVTAANAPRGGATAALSPKVVEEKYSPLVTLRRTIFPIYGRQEVIKFLLIGTIKFFIILALTLTRDTKDTLVVTQCGAEAIAFLKVSQAYKRPAEYYKMTYLTGLNTMLSKDLRCSSSCYSLYSTIH